MSEELPEFLGGDAPVDEAAQVQPPVVPAAEAPAEAAPAPQSEPQAPSAPAAAPEAPAGEQPPPHHVPLAAHLDERERRQAAERRANELEQWKRQQEAARTAPQAPDPYVDPEGFRAYQDQVREQQFEARLYDQNLRLSERVATVTHGPDVVKAAKAWYDAEGGRDPFLDQKVRASADPYDTVISEWKQRQLLSRLDPNDLDAFQQWKASQAGQATPGAPQTAPAAQPPARPQAPRASLAAAPSAGAVAAPVPADGAQAFEGMFGPK